MEEQKDILAVNTSEQSLSEQLINENDPEQIQNIIDLFNISFQKKNIIRTQKLNDLQDKISDQIEERLTKKADEFSNKDLLDYFKVMQDSINKNTLNLDFQDRPIQIIQNQTNIQSNEEKLSRESKEKIADAVQSILNKLNFSDENDTIYIPEENVEIDE